MIFVQRRQSPILVFCCISLRYFAITCGHCPQRYLAPPKFRLALGQAAGTAAALAAKNNKAQVDVDVKELQALDYRYFSFDSLTIQGFDVIL